ncbi:hypothetical protein ACFOGG_07675 [Brenneria rubrifaciens]
MIVLSLTINTFLNYTIVNNANKVSINNMLNSVATSHSMAIGEWVESKTRMISSLHDNVLVNDDPIPVFKQIAASGAEESPVMGG